MNIALFFLEKKHVLFEQKVFNDTLAPYYDQSKPRNMSISRLTKLIFAFGAASILAGCSYDQMVKMAQEQELRVNPSPLELHGDSVKFDVNATLPVGMLKKNRLYTVKTYYNYGDPTQDLDKFEFNDVEFPNQKVEQPSISKSFSMFYTDEMESGKLFIKGVASNLEKTKFKETPEMEIAQGIITTSRLVKNAYKVTYAPHGYNNREELIPTQVVFHFDKGSARLKSTEVKGDAGQKLDAFIASKNATRTVKITGSHSPEGLESVNSKLAEDRASVIREFYFKKMKQYDYKNMADSIKFETVAIFQKWDGFVKLINKNADLTPEQKQEVIALTKTSKSFEEQEKDIAKLSFYKTLTESIYPELRLSTTEILSVKPKKTDAEINVLASAIVKGNAGPDTLSYEELMYASTLTPLLDEKEKIFEAASKHHGSYQAHNNLGAVYLEMAQKATSNDELKTLVEKAQAQFKLSINKKANAYALNNNGACELILGNKENAIAQFTEAKGQSVNDKDVKNSIQGGLGSAYIMTGDYANAISASKAAGDEIDGAVFNLGLAQLLSKDFENAGKTFESAVYINKEDALSLYCAAIVGARKKDAAVVGTELTEAFKIDASLKQKALNDLEFLNLREDPAFKAAIE